MHALSVYTLLFVITSAHTLLGPFMQLYTGNFIWSVFTCTAFCHYKCIHFEWLRLLYILTLATHTCGAHTVLRSVVLLYIHTLVHSLFSGNVYTTALYNCTLASASLASALSNNHGRALNYLLRSHWSNPNLLSGHRKGPLPFFCPNEFLFYPKSFL